MSNPKRETVDVEARQSGLCLTPHSGGLGFEDGNEGGSSALMESESGREVYFSSALKLSHPSTHVNRISWHATPPTPQTPGNLAFRVIAPPHLSLMRQKRAKLVFVCQPSISAGWGCEAGGDSCPEVARRQQIRTLRSKTHRHVHQSHPGGKPPTSASQSCPLVSVQFSARGHHRAFLYHWLNSSIALGSQTQIYKSVTP